MEDSSYEVGSEMASGETETPVAREDEREKRERERMKEAFRELQGEIPDDFGERRGRGRRTTRGQEEVVSRP